MRRPSAPLLVLAAVLGIAGPGAATSAVAGVDPPAASGTVTAPASRLVLPAPTGRERLGTVSLHLVDSSRRDPWVAAQTSREIVIQLWYPAEDVGGHPVAPWVSPGVAARAYPPDLAAVVPLTHAHEGAPARPGRHPVVLYSPGYGLQRTDSTALVEDLAAHGYVVVTVDHPHDAQFVEFPGGRIETQVLPPPTGDPGDEDRVVATALATRVADVRFTLGQLAAIAAGRDPDAEGRPLPRGLAAAMDLRRIGMFGHSLGGATAAQAMLEDPRIDAGLDMDGTLFGSVVAAGLGRPFLLMGSQREGAGDETWDALWAKLRGPRHELELVGSGHLSFTDFEVLAPQAGVPPDVLAPSYGTIDGDRAVAVQRAYLRAFFDRYLRGRPGTSLSRPSPCYPEMRVLR